MGLPTHPDREIMSFSIKDQCDNCGQTIEDDSEIGRAILWDGFDENGQGIGGTRITCKTCCERLGYEVTNISEIDRIKKLIEDQFTSIKSLPDKVNEQNHLTFLKNKRYHLGSFCKDKGYGLLESNPSLAHEYIIIADMLNTSGIKTLLKKAIQFSNNKTSEDDITTLINNSKIVPKNNEDKIKLMYENKHFVRFESEKIISFKNSLTWIDYRDIIQKYDSFSEINDKHIMCVVAVEENWDDFGDKLIGSILSSS